MDRPAARARGCGVAIVVLANGFAYADAHDPATANGCPDISADAVAIATAVATASAHATGCAAAARGPIDRGAGAEMPTARKPYGNVRYADPGYLGDKVHRYPLERRAGALRRRGCATPGRGSAGTSGATPPVSGS